MRTYDDWKTDYDGYQDNLGQEVCIDISKVAGECDCCGKRRITLRQCWVSGTETWACAACRDDDEEMAEAE
jgi:hypothetical protein